MEPRMPGVGPAIRHFIDALLVAHERDDRHEFDGLVLAQCFSAGPEAGSKVILAPKESRSHPEGTFAVYAWKAPFISLGRRRWLILPPAWHGRYKVAIYEDAAAVWLAILSAPRPLVDDGEQQHPLGSLILSPEAITLSYPGGDLHLAVDP